VPITHNKNCSSIGSEQPVQIVGPAGFDGVDGASCILYEKKPKESNIRYKNNFISTYHIDKESQADQES
jgi:hypothetical protein